MGKFALLCSSVVAIATSVFAAPTVQSATKAISLPQLFEGTVLEAPLPFSAFAVPMDAQPALHGFNGRLTLQVESQHSRIKVIKDTYQLFTDQFPQRAQLPAFNFDFVQHGNMLIPARTGSLASKHPAWEYILEPGRVWNLPDEPDFSRAAIPFALQEKNANCIHNGVMTFAYNQSGDISDVIYQIASETCLYFKADLWGKLAAQYQPSEVAHSQQLRESYDRHHASRIARKPINALVNDYGLDPQRLVQQLSAEHITKYGVYLDGIHYQSHCQTRYGDYPFCDELRLPSYSTAKSLFAGVVMMRLAALYPTLPEQHISNLVPQCDGTQWDGVSLQHALDMTTGNYIQAGYMQDETAPHSNQLFLAEDHASKIDYVCNDFPRRAEPGQQWVYHTADTYLAANAMNRFLKVQRGQQADIFNNILLEDIWRPLNIHPSSRFTRRTYDAVGQPFAGWGLTFNSDDLIKLTRFISIDDGKLNGQQLLSVSHLEAALQQSIERGAVPISRDITYKTGFWAADLSQQTQCKSAIVPFMSGFGGISVVMMPNGGIFYYVSDNDEHLWYQAAIALHEVKSFCPEV